MYYVKCKLSLSGSNSDINACTNNTVLSQTQTVGRVAECDQFLSKERLVHACGSVRTEPCSLDCGASSFQAIPEPSNHVSRSQRSCVILGCSLDTCWMRVCHDPSPPLFHPHDSPCWQNSPQTTEKSPSKLKSSLNIRKATRTFLAKRVAAEKDFVLSVVLQFVSFLPISLFSVI